MGASNNKKQHSHGAHGHSHGAHAAAPASLPLGPHSSHPRVTSMIRTAAQQFPNGEATIDGDRVRTWAQVEDRIARLAGGLSNELKLSNGGRIALMALNSDKYLEIFFASPWAGGVVVPLNVRLAAPEIVDQLNDCAAEILIVDDAFAAAVVPAVRAACKSVKHFIFCGFDPKSAKDASITLDYEDLIKRNVPSLEKGRGGYDTFMISFTGGTTGKSKGVELTHSNIVVNGLGHVGLQNYSPKSRYLHSAPMFHLADGASTFGVTMAGGTHVFIPRFTPEDMLASIEKNKVNRAMMVPAMIAMMLQSPAAKTRDCSTLENVMYGASPMPAALLEPALKLFPRATFRQGYGMTETSPAITTLAPEFHDPALKKITSVGRPVPWVEVKIFDKNDKEVPRGTVGEIVTRGPHVMKGYWNMPEKTAEALRGGWMHTEDGGMMDDDGFVYIVDRLKDMIISGGENVYSAEVEAACMSHSNVAMCAVVGTPDPKFVEIVTAVIVPKTLPFDEKSLIEHCRSKIGGFKVPRRVVVVKELPMSGAGKILKNKVREQLGTDGLGRAKM